MLGLAQVQSKSHLSRDQSMPAGEPHNSASNVWSNCLIQLRKKHNVVTVRWIWSEHRTDAHHLSPYNMGQCRFSEYTCSYCIRVLSWKARMAVHQKQFPQSTRCMQHGGVCWRSVAEWRRWSLIWEEESFSILASLLQRTWRILFFLGSSRRLFKRSRISAQILASWVSH